MLFGAKLKEDEPSLPYYKSLCATLPSIIERKRNIKALLEDEDLWAVYRAASNSVKKMSPRF